MRGPGTITERSRHSYRPEAEALPSGGHADGGAAPWGERGVLQARAGIGFGPVSKIPNSYLRGERKEALDSSMP